MFRYMKPSMNNRTRLNRYTSLKNIKSNVYAYMVRILNVLMLWLITSILCLPVWAATPAGTRIVNQAEATYFDTLTGETITLLSNYASLVVATLCRTRSDSR